MAAVSGETFLRLVVLAGMVCAAISAEAETPVPDLSSNGVGWIAINRDFVAVRKIQAVLGMATYCPRTAS
jgi:hypothetical protein